MFLALICCVLCKICSFLPAKLMLMYKWDIDSVSFSVFQLKVLTASASIHQSSSVWLAWSYLKSNIQIPSWQLLSFYGSRRVSVWATSSRSSKGALLVLHNLSQCRSKLRDNHHCKKMQIILAMHEKR